MTCTCKKEWAEIGAHFANCPFLIEKLKQERREAEEGMDEFMRTTAPFNLLTT